MWQRDVDRGCELAGGRWWPPTVCLSHAASFYLTDGRSLHPPDAGVYQTERQHVPDDDNYY
jgi:nitrite reductase/ring-hydroxylating ferredoxin subunit